VCVRSFQLGALPCLLPGDPRTHFGDLTSRINFGHGQFDSVPLRGGEPLDAELSSRVAEVSERILKRHEVVRVILAWGLRERLCDEGAETI